jgi:hypothetical protein
LVEFLPLVLTFLHRLIFLFTLGFSKILNYFSYSLLNKGEERSSRFVLLVSD